MQLLWRHLPDVVFDLEAGLDQARGDFADLIDPIAVPLACGDDALEPLRQGLGVGLEHLRDLRQSRFAGRQDFGSNIRLTLNHKDAP